MEIILAVVLVGSIITAFIVTPFQKSKGSAEENPTVVASIQKEGDTYGN